MHRITFQVFSSTSNTDMHKRQCLSPGNPQVNGTQRTLLNQGDPTCCKHYAITTKMGGGEAQLCRVEPLTAVWLETCWVGKGMEGQRREKSREEQGGEE